MIGCLSFGLVMLVLAALGVVVSPVLSALIVAFVLLVGLMFSNFEGALVAAFFCVFVLEKFHFVYDSPNKGMPEIILFANVVPLLLVFVLWSMRRLMAEEKRRTDNYLNVQILLFIVWIATTLLWTRDSVHGVNNLLSMVVNLILVVLFTVFIFDRASLQKGLAVLVTFSIVLGCITFSSKFFSYEKEVIISKRLEFLVALGGDKDKGSTSEHLRAGGFAETDQAAFVMNFFTFIALFFFIREQSKRGRARFALLLFFLFCCDVLTGSKGGLGGLVIGLLFVLLFHPALSRRRIVTAFFVGLLLVSAFLFNGLVIGENRIARSFSGTSSSKIAKQSLTSRTDLWKKGFKASFDTYGAGLGAGTSALVAGKLPHMHSFFLSALFDLGFFGFFLYVSIYLRITWRLIKAMRATGDLFYKGILYCSFGALVAASIQGLTISEYPLIFPWFMIGFIVAITARQHTAYEAAAV